jgi:protein-tyrosine kinase
MTTHGTAARAEPPVAEGHPSPVAAASGIGAARREPTLRGGDAGESGATKSFRATVADPTDKGIQMDRDSPTGGPGRPHSEREGRTTIERYMHQLDAAASSQRAVLKSVETNPVPERAGTPTEPEFASAPREIVPLTHLGSWRHGSRAAKAVGGPFPVASLTPLAEAPQQFDALRVNLWTRRAHGESKLTLFLSAQSAAGATTTATNYATLLSRDPRARVLLIDANMRAKERAVSDEAASGWQESPDLAALLLDGATLAPRDATTGLYFLPSGLFRATPLALLQSEAFDRFLEAARAAFDHVVIDGPALHGSPEALVLARKADETVLVIDAGSTRRQSALWAKQQIEGAGGRLVGVVLNKRRFYIPSWLYRWI